VRVRVVLVDEEVMFRESLRLLLEASGSVEVVGEAGEGREAVRLTKLLRPDVVLMDLWLPGLSGIEATRQLVAWDSSTRVLMLSMQHSRRYVEEALRAGAVGYALKSEASGGLLSAIRTVHQGGRYLPKALMAQAVDAIRLPGEGSSLARLTGREREVLQGIVEGRDCRAIAVDLGISRRTVECHRSHLMRKLGARKTASLVRIAIREGLVRP
jgi:DNA-binding NarL/FixJ family response regulator